MSIQIPWKKSSIFLKRNWAWKRMKIHLANSRTPIAVKELCQSSRSMDFWISNNLDKFKAYNSGIVLNKIDRYFVIKNAIKYLTHSCILHETSRTTRACANAWSIEVFPQLICTNTGLYILLCSVTQFWSRNIFNEIQPPPQALLIRCGRKFRDTRAVLALAGKASFLAAFGSHIGWPPITYSLANLGRNKTNYWWEIIWKMFFH